MGIKLNPLSGFFDLTGSSGVSIGSTVGGSTPHAILRISATNQLDEIGPLTDGQLIIGVTGGAAQAATLTGTTNQLNITNGAGVITLSLPQDIHTGATPTFTSLLVSPAGGIDTTTTGTLAIGTGNADVINIGNSGVTVNIQGDTFYQNVTNLQVTDKLITINKGGSVGSASNSGIELEEGGVITAYIDTTADRLAWELKAPATAGVVAIVPGISGFTLDQGSHDPVTLGAVGSSPNANGATLTSQVLNLEPANATNPGVITASAQTFGGLKTFQNGISLNAQSVANVSSIDASTSGIIVQSNDLNNYLYIDNSVVDMYSNANLTISSNGLMALTTNNSAFSITTNNGTLTLNSGTGITTLTSSNKVVVNAPLLEPQADVTTSLGTALTRFQTIFTQSIFTEVLSNSGGTIDTQGNLIPVGNDGGVTVGDFFDKFGFVYTYAVGAGNSRLTLQAVNGIEIQNLAADPVSLLTEGTIYYNSVSDVIRLYNGSTWVDARDGGVASSVFNNAANVTIDASGAGLDVVITATDTVSIQGLQFTTGGNVTASNILTLEALNAHQLTVNGAPILTIDNIGLSVETGVLYMFNGANVVELNAGNVTTSYAIDFPAAAPTANTALVFDGSTYIWGAPTIDLTSNVTGVLPIANGGTNLSALGTTDQLLSVNSAATDLEYRSIIAGAGIEVNYSPGNIQIDNLAFSQDDVSENAWLGIANNTANQAITGLQFANTVKWFEAVVDVELDVGNFSATTYKIQARRRDVDWSTNEIIVEFFGDIVEGLEFSIDNTGQVLVTTPNISGFVSGIVSFRAITLS